jgi:transcription elongation factor Elf1
MRNPKDYYTDKGEPIRCLRCDSQEFTRTIKDTMEYTVMEYELDCSNCGFPAAYWATGYFEPDAQMYAYEYLEKFNALLIK